MSDVGTTYQVKVGKLPGTIKEMTVDVNSTVGDIISQADLSAEGFEIRLNGSPADAGTKVSEGDTVLLVRKIQGNIFTRIVYAILSILK